MTAGALPSVFHRYRILSTLVIVLAALSLVQILTGGLGRLVGPQVGGPTAWTISYQSAEGQTVVERVAAPEHQLSKEGRTKGPVDVEMGFRECQRFSQYQFWVGPYGRDDTDRQPSAWTLSVRGETGGWIPADTEQIDTPYRNSAWYTFPLHAGQACIRQVRWDITKEWAGDIFRLYAFQLYTPDLASRIESHLPSLRSNGAEPEGEAETVEAARWTAFYMDLDARPVVSHFAAPQSNSFKEVIATAPVRIEMDFPSCRSFRSYRFWVGPYGSDDTDRQPSDWTLSVRGDTGDWVRADSEQIKEAYRNNTWYTFPLHAGTACVRHVRWDITKAWYANILRLYSFQLSTGSAAARASEK